MNWSVILEKGSAFLGKKDKEYRRYIYYRGKRYMYSIVLWNANHPEDPVQKNEIVHHKNEDKTDDRLDNYEKMTRAGHMRWHSSNDKTNFLKAMIRSRKGGK